MAAIRLVNSCLSQIEALQPKCNAFITVTADRARQAADIADKLRAHPLAGLPIAVKDNFCTAGIRTTAASRMLKDFVPPYDATVWRRLSMLGAGLIGKTNMDEFGMGSESRFSHFGAVQNVIGGQLHVAGGSSGGSAVAVAQTMAFAAIGSDTGGSVRLPASYCGIYGLKPTYGALSRFGLIAYASSLDCPGIFTRSVDNLLLLFDALNEYDPNDPTSVDNETRQASHPSPFLDTHSLRGLRIGVPENFVTTDLPTATGMVWEKALLQLEQRGAELHVVSLPHMQHALPTYYIIAPAEASSNLARYDGIKYGYRSPLDDGKEPSWSVNTRDEAFGEEVKRRILAGTFVLSASYFDSYFLQAQKVRRLICNDFHDVFAAGIHMLVTPTAPSTPPVSTSSLGSSTQPFLQDLFTVPPSLAGLPALSVPFGTIHGLPLGIQLIANAFNEHLLCRVARELV